MHAKIAYPLCGGDQNTTAMASGTMNVQTLSSAVGSKTSTGAAQVVGAAATAAPGGSTCFDMQSNQLLTGPGRLAKRGGMSYSEVKRWE